MKWNIQREQHPSKEKRVLVTVSGGIGCAVLPYFEVFKVRTVCVKKVRVIVERCGLDVSYVVLIWDASTYIVRQ